MSIIIINAIINIRISFFIFIFKSKVDVHPHFVERDFQDSRDYNYRH